MSNDTQQPDLSRRLIPPANDGLLGGLIRFCLENKLVMSLAVIAIIVWGLMVAPFDWELGFLPRSPVPVDAIPDIGENQQIVFTEWMGRSPQDMDDQISYPLTVALLGVPGVKTIRSYSFFGFSTIYVIFDDDVEFYWSRSRVLEKLNGLPQGTLPQGVQPTLGPDATPLGQIFWYTLEGRDPDGNPIGGWDLHELRTVQDWYVRYALLSAKGISEVASVGGFVQEYQIDIDPDAMRAARVSLNDIIIAVRKSNIDVGARTIEFNKVEYFIRGLGFVQKPSDLENSVVAVNDNVPIYIKDVAKVTLGPALRRGALDKGGAEAVGGVIVVRYGFNPLEAIKNVKDKIKEIKPGLRTKAVVDYAKTTRDELKEYAELNKFDAFDGPQLNHEEWVKHLRSIPREEWPEWITTSQITLVPFYDRSELIHETLGTLHTALIEEILVTVIVILVMVMHLRSSVLIGALLPLAVLMCFIAMWLFHVDANIVALSGIAIAIGTMVDMGIILCENILRHLDEADADENRLEVILRASKEVGGAVLTAVATTVISFLPIFTMIGQEGKLFQPLAFTKTFALIASVIVALTMIPPAAHVLFSSRNITKTLKQILLWLLLLAGVLVGIFLAWWAGAILVALAVHKLVENRLSPQARRLGPWVVSGAAVIFVGIVLTRHWLPLGAEAGMFRNLFFVSILIGGLLGFFHVFQHYLYEPILRWCLANKVLFLSIPLGLVIVGGTIWQGLGKEFMPSLDEGSFLYMPTTMPHASIGEAMDVLKLQDQRITDIPEVKMAVGKIGRVDSPLDPAPVSMIETIINYKSEYITDKHGRRLKFEFDPDGADWFRDRDGIPLPAADGLAYMVSGRFAREEGDHGELIQVPGGIPFRQWRRPLDPKLNPGRKAWPGIQEPDDIWQEITKAAKIPGTTSAPRLQPIAARIVMLQSGMRAPMGVKVKGPDLATIEKVALQIEGYLKQVSSVEASAVIADRIVGKPYLNIEFDRLRLARYGLTIRDAQDVVEVAIGGKKITTTVEGRQRFAVRVRYPRELRSQKETMEKILVPAKDGSHVPLSQVADITYSRGPQVIKSEDTALIGYVLFDMKPGNAEVNVVEDCQRFLKEKIESGEFALPPGVSYTFAGNYENQIRSEKTLMVVLPLAFFLIFLILYFHFRSVLTTFIVLSGIGIAWSGGFIMLWLYGQPWFLNFNLFGADMQTLFQIHPINLSVAVWVGFLALFGIATDDGVVMATYLDQSFVKRRITTAHEAREATILAGLRRVRPCLMTSATTILALLPVLTSTGRGADIMVPMAIPSFGGMTIVILTMFTVPTLYCAVQEWKLKHGVEDPRFVEQAST